MQMNAADRMWQAEAHRRLGRVKQYFNEGDARIVEKFIRLASDSD